MKFSLFFEMQIANATPDKEVRVFRDCVEQAVLAEALGYHRVWRLKSIRPRCTTSGGRRCS
jgi:hypothetical protein